MRTATARVMPAKRVNVSPTNTLDGYLWAGRDEEGCIVSARSCGAMPRSPLGRTHQLKQRMPADTAARGSTRLRLRAWACSLAAASRGGQAERLHSVLREWVAQASASTNVWPASRPLTPARMLMLLVQKTETASM